MYITFLSTISILQTGKLKLYGREKLKVMTEAPLLFLEEAQSESREGKKSENLHKRIHIHRAVYLFTTKHNEIDTVVASHCVSTLRFRLLCCWLAGLGSCYCYAKLHISTIYLLLAAALVPPRTINYIKIIVLRC